MDRKNLLSILYCVVVLVLTSFVQFGTAQDLNTFNNQFVTGNGRTFAGTNQNPGLTANTGNFGQTGQDVGQFGNNFGLTGTNTGQTGNTFGQSGNNLGQGTNLGQGNNFGQGTNLGQPGNNFGQGSNLGQGNNFGQGTNLGQPGNNFGQGSNLGQQGNNFGQGTNLGQPGNNFGQGTNLGQPGTNIVQPGNTFGQGNTIGQTGNAFGIGNNGGGLQPDNNQGGVPGLAPAGGFNTIGNTFGNPFLTGEGFGNGGQFFGGLGVGTFGGPANNPPQLSLGNQLFMNLAQNPLNYRYGTCRLNSSSSTVYGRADFRQFLFGDAPVDIRIQVWGLPPSPVDTQRGIHIHEFGDDTDMCARVGPHFNPIETRHGGRNTFPFLRHVGDLGNMLQSPQGVTSTQFRDNVISLIGGSSIVGRALVIKLERDDEGLGTNVVSTQNGNARTPLACCTIGRSGPNNWSNPMTEAELMAAASQFQNLNTAPNQGINQGSPTGGSGNPSFNFLGKK